MKMLRVVMMLGMMVPLTACLERVSAGTVGIMVDLYGSDKGVQAKELGPGRYWVGFNQELYTFPTFTQTYTWDASNKEEIQFQSKENLPVLADVGVTYHVTPDKVYLLFQKYRKGIDEITNIYIHNMVRDAFVETASKLPIETIYGEGKVPLIVAAQKAVQDQVEPIGIVIEKIYLVGKFGLPAQIETAINNKISATQQAEQEVINVTKANALSDQVQAKARGDANSRLTLATADAQAIKLKAEALNASPLLVQWEAVNKWDGKLPNVNGGAMPFINVK